MSHNTVAMLWENVQVGVDAKTKKRIYNKRTWFLAS